MNSSDILVEIPDHHLPQLAALFEEKATWAPYMTSFVHTAIKWKKSVEYKDKIIFLSPYNCWKEDGTIIAVIKLFPSEDIVVFTLDDDCTNLYKGLNETTLITFENKRCIFYAVHEKHIPTVRMCLEKKNIKIAGDIKCFIYAIAPEEAKKFIVECPPDVYIQKLDSSAANQINSLWPHRFLHSEKYLASYLDANGGCGIFLKRSNQMIAWVTKHAFGHLAMLQTKDEYKRKGYASLVTKAVSKEIAEEGHWPLGTILVENKTSMAMFEKLGFRNIGACHFVIVME